MSMGWIEREYPLHLYIVEVKYSGDIAIADVRAKKYPKEKDNKYGFTENYRSYEDAKKAAKNIASQLNIKCGF